MIKNKNRGGFIDRQRKGVGVGEEGNNSSFFFLALHYIHIKHGTAITFFPITIFLTAAWLAQLGERRSAEREVAGSNCRSNTQGL